MKIQRRSSRALLVALSISALGLGTALVGATSASADDLPFAISSPVDGQSVSTGEITVTGTGTVGDSVSVFAQNAYTDGDATVNDDGIWALTLTFVTGAIGPHEIDANDNQLPDSASVTVDVTPPPSSNALHVLSPAPGSTSSSRTITYTGTAPEGSTVSLDTDATANYVPPVTVDASGTWSITTTFEVGTPENALLTTASAVVSGVDANGENFVPQNVSVALPAASPTPVIAAATGSGPKVTVTGTASGGPAVAVFFSPVDAAAREAANTLPEGAFESTGVLDAQGRFSAATTLAAGQWYATAVLLDSTDVHTGHYLSLASSRYDFALTAAVAPTAAGDPGATPTAASAAATTPASGELAFTGSNPIGGLVAGALRLAAGLTLIVSRRRAAFRL